MTLLPILRGVLAVICLGAAAGAIAAETPANPPPPPVAAAGSPVMLGARIVGDDQRVRFVADLSRKVESAAFVLADPYRIVVDLPEVNFALPELAGTSGRGLISAFRYGMISPGKSRIVIDLTGPAKIDRTFVTDPADGQPARLVIDVVPSSRAEFLAVIRNYRDLQAASSFRKADRLPVQSSPKGDGPLIVIDPGHGGIDLGARSSDGTLEKDVTLAFGKALGERLKSTGRYRIAYTRNDDSFIALGERVAAARTANADLFISVHANSFPGNSVRGAIVFTVSDEASDKMAAQLAESENQSDALAGIDVDAADKDQVKDILIDLTRRETRNFGLVFARNLVKELGKSTKMFKVPHQEAGFKVLEAPDVPSALIELGYLTNPADAKLMVSAEWQGKAADSILTAVDAYFSTRIAGQGKP